MKELIKQLIDSIKEENDFDYNSIDGTWQWALDEMSEETNKVFCERYSKIYALACVIEKLLENE